jgi:hypothetical protein
MFLRPRKVGPFYVGALIGLPEPDGAEPPELRSDAWVLSSQVRFRHPSPLSSLQSLFPRSLPAQMQPSAFPLCCSFDSIREPKVVGASGGK